MRQMLYMIFTALSAGILFLPVMPMILKIVMFLIISSAFVAFAFLKIGTAYADKYFLNVMKYIFRKKIFIHER